jgi:hypothetical protein
MADDMTKLNVTSVSDAATDPFAETKNELVSRFTLLPDDIKGAIMDAKYQQTLFDLAKAEKLTYEELGVLETETTMVLLGMTKPADYRDELQAELKKNDPEIDTIVKAVNEQVFAPIRASLERVYAAKKDPADYIPADIMTPGVPKTPEPARPNAIHYPSMLSTTDKSVFEKAGVVITPAPAPVAPAFASTQVPDRKDLLASIENPSKIAPNIVADRFKSAGPVISATKTTDYSVPKVPAAPAAPASRASDPYREPIN